MSWDKILKGVANIVLDSYIDATKKTGNTSSRDSAETLKDMVNGKIDMNGNPITRREDEEA